MEKAAIDVITSRWGFAGAQIKRGKNLLTEKAPTMAVKKERKDRANGVKLKRKFTMTNELKG